MEAALRIAMAFEERALIRDRVAPTAPLAGSRQRQEAVRSTPKAL